MNMDDLIQQPGQKERLLRKAIAEENHVSLPGTIVSFNPGTQTASVQPTLRRRKGTENLQIPVLQDVPVYFFGGTSGGITFPVAAGDECLVVFADSCIDGWFQNGTVANEISVRHHDYSDGFAFVGFRSMPNVLQEFPMDEPSFWGYKLSKLVNEECPKYNTSGG